MRLNQYRLLGRAGLRVSPLCLGTLTFGNPDSPTAADEATSHAMLELYLERGGNFLDTANVYTDGRSESLLGEALAGRRDQVVIASKYTISTRRGDPNASGNHRKCLVQSLEASLRRLKTDYVDLYYVHAWDGLTPLEEVARALDDIVRQGKALHVGISDAPAWVVARLLTLAEGRGWEPPCCIQIEYSLAERTPERELLPMARALGLAVLPWGPLASGLLTGKYNPLEEHERDAREDSQRRASLRRKLGERNFAIAREVQLVAREAGCSPAQVALAWLLARPGVGPVILGARSVAQLEDNLASLQLQLEPAHVERLEAASRIELGFPHDFLATETVRGLLSGGAEVIAGG